MPSNATVETRWTMAAPALGKSLTELRDLFKNI
jgi:hypothetical protein